MRAFSSCKALCWCFAWGCDRQGEMLCFSQCLITGIAGTQVSESASHSCSHSWSWIWLQMGGRIFNSQDIVEAFFCIHSEVQGFSSELVVWKHMQNITLPSLRVNKHHSAITWPHGGLVNVWIPPPTVNDGNDINNQLAGVQCKVTKANNKASPSSNFRCRLCKIQGSLI